MNIVMCLLQMIFDLGNLTDIEHTIDTGDAKPVRQRVCRTPECFVYKEESHLKQNITSIYTIDKMLFSTVFDPET